MTLFDLPDGLGDLMSTEGLRRLLAVRGVGAVSAERIACRYRSFDALAQADRAEISRLLPRLGPDELIALTELAPADPLPADVRAVSSFDAEWPAWATGMPGAPAVLYVRGTLPAHPTVAVVGTRHPTEYGLSVVAQVVSAAASRGIGIVSGLALGIDGAAHEAALGEGVPTWAILGGGVDEPTPPEHVGLADRILAAGGGLIAEVPPNVRPNPQRLVARNRLQVAAATVVVAAQCGIPSGTLHTVRFAIEQHRRLVVPRPSGRWVDEPQSAGNLALTDPAGCSAKVVGAVGKTAVEVESRRPVADVVLNSREDVDRIWESVP